MVSCLASFGFSRLISSGLAALIQLSGPALQPGQLSGSALVPLERATHGDTPVLSFRSGAQSLRFLVDTGASSTLVSPALVQRLGLADTPIPPAAFGLAGAGEGCADLQPRRVVLPSLQAAPVPSGRANSLRLRGAEALVLAVAGLPPGVDGVLGAPQLRQLPLWIDPGADRLALGSAALDLAERARASVAVTSAPTTLPMRWSQGVPLLRLRLRPAWASAPGPAETTMEALADTGAEGLFVTEALAAALPQVEPSRPVQVAGFCGLQPARWIRVQGPTLLGGLPPAPVQAIVTANPVFEALGVGAIVGQELLRSHRQLWRLDTTPPSLLLWGGGPGS